MEKESALRLVAALLNLRAKSPNFISDSLVSFAAWNDAYVHAQQFIIEIKFSDPNDSSEIEQSLLREMSDLFAGTVSEEELKNGWTMKL